MTAIISIVDDDAEMRGSLTSLLRSAGYNVRAFPDAASFLAVGAGDRGCVLTDLNMPGMNGLGLQAELKRRGSTVAVIVMTAFPTAQSRGLAMDNGAAAFLTKPIDPDQLLDRLHALVGR